MKIKKRLNIFVDETGEFGFEKSEKYFFSDKDMRKILKELNKKRF